MNEKEYETYIEWKNWAIKPNVSEGNALYFDRELKECSVQDAKSVLEIGFGECEFLIWCTKNGKQVVGVEINNDLVTEAEKVGHNVAFADLTVEIPEEVRTSGPFDLICGFDVIEHLTHEQLAKLLKNLFEISHQDTKLLFRFPNGLSPFGRAYQHGDFTHKESVTDSKLRQIAIGTGFRLSCFKNAARAFDYRGIKGLVKRFAILVRNLFEYVISMSYFCRRLPFDPVAVAVLERDEKA